MITPETSKESLPENLVSISTTSRHCGAAVIDIIEYRGAGSVLHRLPSGDGARLSGIVEEVGERAEPRLRRDLPCAIAHRPGQMVYAPAGVELWGFSADTRYVKEVAVSFDLEAIGARLELDLSSGRADSPRLRFSDDRLWRLMQLLGESSDDADPGSRLYWEGITTAIAGRVFEARPSTGPSEIRLPPWQLRRVLDHLQDCLPDPVSLDELARLAGLSTWHFSRAFKGSTGMAPYRWQLEARIQRAQSLLLNTGASLDQVAEATGFADATHFGKTFRKIVGTAPGAWRALRKA